MRIITARKSHWCSLCGRPIESGSKHAFQRVTPWEHEANDFFWSYRAHLGCDAMWNAKICDLWGGEFWDCDEFVVAGVEEMLIR